MSEQRHISISDVVKDVIAEEQLDARDYPRLLSFAVRGFYYVSRTADSEVKTIDLDWTNTTLRLIDFPIDYIDWHKVGVLVPRNGSYVVMTLSVNKALKKPSQADIVAAECSCEDQGTLLANSQAVAAGFNPFSYYSVFRNFVRGNQIVGELYGFGGGESSFGSFNIDKENDRFVFSPEVNTSVPIILEYKANLLANKDRTRISWSMREPLIAWVKWRMLSRRNSNRSEREEQKVNFLNAYNEYWNEQEGMTKDQILDRLNRRFAFYH